MKQSKSKVISSILLFLSEWLMWLPAVLLKWIGDPTSSKDGVEVFPSGVLGTLG